MITRAKQAEQHCHKLCTGRQVWTPKYTKNRDKQLFWLRLLAHQKGKHVNSRYLQGLARKTDIFQLIGSMT
jgi:hypothetical protein